MGRLSVVVLYTSDLGRQQEFYEKSLGLAAASTSPRWVQFGTRHAALALRPLAEGGAPRIELGFDVPSLAERLALLESRGHQPQGAVEESADCRIARFADPDGNVVQLVERARRSGGTTSAGAVRLSHGIVNAHLFEACAHFYHDALGFRMAEEREHWIEFDTGDARLTLHASRDADGLPLSPDQSVAFALMDEDLDAWADELRGRGVRFATTPTDEEIGRMAEVEDADGWFVVLRGPEPEVPFEESLAEDYADEDTSRIELIRKTGEAEPSGRPGFGSRKQAKKRNDRVATRGFEALQRASRDDRNAPASGDSRGPRSGDAGGGARSFPPRPFALRPAGGPGGPSRPFTPRPDRPPGSAGPRPFTPRPDGPRPAGGPPRSPGDAPRGPRPAGPGAPRTFGPRPPGGGSGPSRPGPRPDRPAVGGAPRPASSRPDTGPRRTPDAGPRPAGPPRPPRREE